MTDYTKIKQAMNSAGIKTSPDNEWTPEDDVNARSFCFFRGIDIRGEFHRFEEFVKDLIVAPADKTPVAPQVPATPPQAPAAPAAPLAPVAGVQVDDTPVLPTADTIKTVVISAPDSTTPATPATGA